jgi:glutamyl-Q tRNA(Asp) synthetase
LRRCRSRRRSAANAARSSTATATTATAEAAARLRYRGRFAPSPTGALHGGSLYAAVGSWLDARAAGGEWLLRIEDVDRAREAPGAADAILRTLEAFGLHWDGEVVRQSDRGDLYAAALSRLREAALVYPCSCTRRDLPSAPPGEESRYPGTCRAGSRHSDVPLALRFRAGAFPGPVTVEDRLQGPLTQDVDAVVGDFVLRRRDGFWAYQLAVVVDDALQGITDVVRGLDLRDNTPRQRLLQAALGYAPVRYLHLPLVVEPDGRKLSKSRRSAPVDPAEARAALGAVLRALAVPLPAELAGAPVAEQLAWAARNWDPARLAGRATVPDGALGDAPGTATA